MNDITKNAILMSTYNGEHIIDQQLNSILCQSFDDFIIYIRDDGSTDNTLNIINRYQAEHPGRITIVQDNLGIWGLRGLSST